jgi:hypothetical protein
MRRVRLNLAKSDDLGSFFGERTRPRVQSATPSSLTPVSGFSEGAEPCTRGRVRSQIKALPIRRRDCNRPAPLE